MVSVLLMYVLFLNMAVIAFMDREAVLIQILWT